MSVASTEQLLKETVGTARQREREAFEKVCEDARSGIVLFGAGELGRKLLRAMRSGGLEPIAVVDNHPRLQGTKLGGIEIRSPEEIAKQFGATALFVVAIFRGLGDEGMISRLAFLRKLGCRRVTSFLPLAWRYSSDLLPHYGAERPSVLLENAAELMKVSAVWADALSQEVFRGQLLWRLKGDFSGVGVASPDQYFPKDIVFMHDHEAFVDAGAYDGDTLKALGRRFARAWAIEPDPSSAYRLHQLGDPRVTVIQCALGDAPGTAPFISGRGIASALGSAGDGMVRVETLDRLLAGERPTFLKLDVEGAEQSALRGARCVLDKNRPLVAACVYHRPDDLWKIPRFLRETLPDHSLFLRAHQNDGFELVTYAIPSHRLAG